MVKSLVKNWSIYSKTKNHKFSHMIDFSNNSTVWIWKNQTKKKNRLWKLLKTRNNDIVGCFFWTLYEKVVKKIVRWAKLFVLFVFIYSWDGFWPKYQQLIWLLSTCSKIKPVSKWFQPCNHADHFTPTLPTPKIKSDPKILEIWVFVVPINIALE